MAKHLRSLVVLKAALIICVFAVTADAQSRFNGGNASIGLNYPGAGLKYLFSKKTALELRYQTADEIKATGLRLYRYKSRTEIPLAVLSGLEAGYIDFKGTSSEGHGVYGGIFFGGEYFISERLGVQLDFGPYYLNLRERKYSLEEGGLGFIANLGLNYYLKL